MYHWASVVLALSLYLPLAVQIIKGQVKQNIATWILWVALDTVVWLSVLVQGGNWYLPLTYVIGGSFMVACQVRAGSIRWTLFETMISALVIVCIIGWYFSGPWLATVLSTTGMVFATIPQIKDSWIKPQDSPVPVYFGYFTANVLSTIAGASWTVEERLYPLACTILCGVIVLISMRRPSSQSV
ncbi:MAG: hypothetical protein ABL899_03385, partial [Nitrospira sp.]